jgi:hypothetical protein
MMGDTVSGIIIASNPTSIGFFYRSFTPFLMRSPWGDGLRRGKFFVYTARVGGIYEGVRIYCSHAKCRLKLVKKINNKNGINWKNVHF